MKLFLCSNGPTSPALESALRALIGPDPQTATCWYIPTAPIHDGMASLPDQQVPDIRHRFGLKQVLSIDPERVTGELLKTKVAELAPRIIWAEMGNTYALRHHLRRSGADEIIRQLVQEEGVVYYGASAGAIVAGQTVQMAFWKDWDDKTVSGQVDGKMWDDKETSKGLDLGGGRSFFPHANGQYASAAWQQKQAERWKHTDHEVVKMADGEGVVIEAGVMRRL
uniref:Uncharacterized protein n=1 Tax=Haptolina brevifila TaxID=156173 RepID=A0A7S2IQQ5_9EUKA|mmetsp:Transcript_69966/g.138700  ORF Transcript_69966/g.138700 Transcript_69966/m.138700 type:complete len:224 (+) Transcript_69966:81-752(+)